MCIGQDRGCIYYFTMKSYVVIKRCGGVVGGIDALVGEVFIAVFR